MNAEYGIFDSDAVMNYTARVLGLAMMASQRAKEQGFAEEIYFDWTGVREVARSLESMLEKLEKIEKGARIYLESPVGSREIIDDLGEVSGLHAIVDLTGWGKST